MKHFRFLLMPLLAAMAIFVTSCGADEDTTTAEESGDTTAAVAPTTDAVTPAAAPINIMIVRHKVKDYAKWKPSYDAHDSLRLASGIHSFVIGRGVDDPNMVLVATKVDDVEKAKAFGKSDHLKKAMAESGVVGTPKMVLLSVPFLSSSAGSDLRTMSFFTVKDWDTWKTSFETGKQFRKDNGVEDRAYGYDVDDNHKVVVVGAVLDSAKVRAYHKSDSLKARMKTAGVEGTPERFWYRVVQTY